MMQRVFGCLNRQVSDAGILSEQACQAAAATAVYRDELTKKQAAPRKAAVKKSVRFADSEPTILGDNHHHHLEKRNDNKISGSSDEKERIRVKVKMTKEEAARLLSKCKEGGLLDFRDVARELVSIPVGRVSVVVPTSTHNIIQQEATLHDDVAQ